MRWLDPNGQLQEAALTADREAVDRGTRLRNARAQDIRGQQHMYTRAVTFPWRAFERGRPCTQDRGGRA
eukprot:609215-Pyramimonas_sp.AAC.1